MIYITTLIFRENTVASRGVSPLFINGLEMGFIILFFYEALLLFSFLQLSGIKCDFFFHP